jgi:hypothetical protein
VIADAPGHDGGMRWRALVIVVGAAALSGCGQSGKQDEVRTVTGRFYAAVQANDGSLACAQLSEPTLKQLEQDEKATCSKAVASLGLSPSPIVHVDVFLTNAKVDLGNGASAFLEQTATGWKISALGCRPTQGDPKEQPMGCAVQS